jgi:hypothetical protein
MRGVTAAIVLPFTTMTLIAAVAPNLACDGVVFLADERFSALAGARQRGGGYILFLFLCIAGAMPQL